MASFTTQFLYFTGARFFTCPARTRRLNQWTFSRDAHRFALTRDSHTVFWALFCIAHRYAIEATCHAPSRQGVYGEIFRVLKPGARFACYEWCLTDKFDKNNLEHQFIKKKIEEGDGLPDMA